MEPPGPRQALPPLSSCGHRARQGRPGLQRPRGQAQSRASNSVMECRAESQAHGPSHWTPGTAPGREGAALEEGEPLPAQVLSSVLRRCHKNVF